MACDVNFAWSLRDHLGSTAAFLNSTGGTQVNESFRAFGVERSPTDWVSNTSTADTNTIAGISRHGYTSESTLTNPGTFSGMMVHLNGRVLDGFIGRMLSADPVIPNIGNTQDFNRYSYARNNPLTLIDPSGFDSCFSVGGTTDGGGIGEGYVDQFPADGGLPEVGVFSGGYQVCIPDYPGGVPSGVPGGAPAAPPRTTPIQPSRGPQIRPPAPRTAPEPTPTPQGDLPTVTVTATDPYSQCLNDAFAAIGVNEPGSETLENLDQAHTAVEGAVESLAGADAVNVGRAFGSGPGLTASTNAAAAQFGAQIQGALESAGPYLKGTGYVLGAASIANGLRTGGPKGAAFASSDFVLESAMSSTLLGAGAAIGFSRVGGTRAVLQSPSMAIIYCSGLGGI